jgi:hypothetical protein
MFAKQRALVGGVILAALASVALATDEPIGKDSDLETLAQNVVVLSTRVGGDLVHISGNLKDAALLEALAVHVRKQGSTRSSP